MVNAEREALWMERVAQWRNSGQSQRAYAEQHGYPQKQLIYWARRLGTLAGQPALLPVTIAVPVVAATSLTLRSPSGWIVTLPPSLPTSWVASLLRDLA